MSDPRFTDPRDTDPRLSDPVLRQEEPAGGIWGWVAGLAVLALIAFIVVAGWNSNNNTAANSPNSPPITTGANAPRNVTPPSTTGSGTTSPTMPSAPSPSTPAQSPNGGR
ncbi:MAG TPA: hypothetical protein VGM57_13235 [Pseudolabrys sp.]